jgi:hypothetical protein
VSAAGVRNDEQEQASAASAFHIAGDPDALLATICPIDEDGHILFGFAGRSRTPGDHDRLLTGSVEIVDYVMEGFVPYLLSAERTREGLKLVVRKSGTNRDGAVDWFVDKYLESKGFAATKSPAWSAGSPLKAELDRV